MRYGSWDALFFRMKITVKLALFYGKNNNLNWVENHLLFDYFLPWWFILTWRSFDEFSIDKVIFIYFHIKVLMFQIWCISSFSVVRGPYYLRIRYTLQTKINSNDEKSFTLIVFNSDNFPCGSEKTAFLLLAG